MNLSNRPLSRFIQCFEHQEFVYLGIPKNALITHSTFFKSNGWKPTSFLEAMKNSYERKYFGHIRCPHERHTKGLTEYLIRRKYPLSHTEIIKTLFSDHTTAEMIIMGVYDEHTAPISYMIDTKQLHIDWIILDHPNLDSETLTNEYFQRNDLDFQIRNDRKHVSGIQKNLLQQAIRDVKHNSKTYQKLFTSYVLVEDLMMYEEIIINATK
jgi:hypothetical protein